MIQTIESELSEELKRSEYILLSRIMAVCQCTILVRKILGMPSLQWTTVLGFEVISLLYDVLLYFNWYSFL